jgi:hypothetical protein
MGMFLIGFEYPIDSFFKIFNLIVTSLILTLIIVPWQKYNGIVLISIHNKKKLLAVTRFLLIISIIPFLTFSVTSAFVILFVENINDFKYTEGVSTDFYKSLPFNTVFIGVSNYLYYFSYFLIPLHFYYLSKKNIRLSILCLIFSFNIILYGVTYFSRSVYIHYFFIYFSFLVMLYGTLGKQLKNIVNKVFFILFIGAMIYFIKITITRFDDGNYYANRIPSSSFIKDPILYSYFDYSSQWYSNSMNLLNSYDFKTFNGQITFQPLLSLLGQFKLISYDYDSYLAFRQFLWSDYWYLFNGFVAYSVYDYGYFFTMILVIFYFFMVNKLKPKNKEIPILNLFSIVLLIQIPLLSIFYSAAGTILLPFLFYFPIFIYMKFSFTIFKNKKYSK